MPLDRCSVIAVVTEMPPSSCTSTFLHGKGLQPGRFTPEQRQPGRLSAQASGNQAPGFARRSPQALLSTDHLPPNAHTSQAAILRRLLSKPPHAAATSKICCLDLSASLPWLGHPPSLCARIKGREGRVFLGGRGSRREKSRRKNRRGRDFGSRLNSTVETTLPKAHFE